MTTGVVSECTELDGMSKPTIIPDNSISVDVPGDAKLLRATSDIPFITSQTPTASITLPTSLEIGLIDLEPKDKDSNIGTFRIFVKDINDTKWVALMINGKTVSQKLSFCSFRVDPRVDPTSGSRAGHTEEQSLKNLFSHNNCID